MTADVREVFARDVESAWSIHATGGQHDVCGQEFGFASGAIDHGHDVAGLDFGHACYGVVGQDGQVVTERHGAEVTQIFFASGFFLVGGGDCDSSDRQSFWRTEESGVRRKQGGNGGTDRAGIDLRGVQTRLSKMPRDFQPNGPCSDDKHLCLDHVA